MFQSFFTTIFRGSSVALCAVTIPPADLRSLSSYYYAVCGRMCMLSVCVCLVFLSVGDLLVNCFVTQRRQISGRNSNGTKHSGGPAEDDREKNRNM